MCAKSFSDMCGCDSSDMWNTVFWVVVCRLTFLRSVSEFITDYTASYYGRQYYYKICFQKNSYWEMKIEEPCLKK